MNHQVQELQFVRQFVDTVTIRPFFEDLRRAKQLSAMLAQLPRIARARAITPTREAA